MNRRTIYLLFVFFALLIVLGGTSLRYFIETLPQITDLEEYVPHLTTRILDYKGNVISEFYTERRQWIPLNQIPVDLQNAFIGVEDDRFFSHWGVSSQGMIRAAVKNFLAGRVVQGGSTITQQLSKLIFLTQERTFGRKIREFLLALQIERRFSKEEILQMYLNQVYFGHGAYGVSAASKIFFNKSVQELTLPECALLAGLPRLPSYYSPFNNPQRALNRRTTVLGRMRKLNYISPEEENLAHQSPLNSQRTPFSAKIAPYFVESVRQDLEQKYGSELLYKGGLTIQTTLDLELQNAAERIMSTALEKFDKEHGHQAEILRAKEKTAVLRKSKSVSSNYVVKASTTITKVQGALIVMDPKNGAIRVMIGGRSFEESQFNRAIQAKRQPGSTFKPFVWLTALDNGFTAASIINDLPVAFQNDGHDWRLIESATDVFQIRQATSTLPEDKVWVPKNYDGKYFGPVTLRKGLEFSRNIVSVRLIDQVNPIKVVEWARKLGIKSALDPFLSLALGTSVVDLMELTSAFAAFANDGIKTEPYAITKITDFEGKTLEENFPKETEAVSPQLNYLMGTLLKGVVAEGTGRAARIIKGSVAGKTGTSQDQRDLWFVGFSPDLVCGAWMGYDDFAPLGKKLASGGILVPWWAEFMKEALKNVPGKDFNVPGGINFVKIDSLTGYLALDSCPKVILEAFKSGTEPKEFCPVDHSAKEWTEIETED